MMKKKDVYNIPNFFTFLRFILIVIMWFIFFFQQRRIIGILLAFALMTDFLDGFLARKLKQETKFGARFDSLADNLTAISVIIWAAFLLPEMFNEHQIMICVVLGLVILAWLFAAIKYKRNPEFHLISNKVSNFTVGIFIVHAFIFDYNKTLLYFSAAVYGCMAIEEILITFTHEDIDENIKSIFKT